MVSKKRVEDVMPIATGHEREELEAELEVSDSCYAFYLNEVVLVVTYCSLVFAGFDLVRDGNLMISTIRLVLLGLRFVWFCSLVLMVNSVLRLI